MTGDKLTLEEITENKLTVEEMKAIMRSKDGVVNYLKGYQERQYAYDNPDAYIRETSSKDIYLLAEKFLDNFAVPKYRRRLKRQNKDILNLIKIMKSEGRLQFLLNYKANVKNRLGIYRQLGMKITEEDRLKAERTFAQIKNIDENIVAIRLLQRQRGCIKQLQRQINSKRQEYL